MSNIRLIPHATSGTWSILAEFRDNAKIVGWVDLQDDNYFIRIDPCIYPVSAASKHFSFSEKSWDNVNAAILCSEGIAFHMMETDLEYQRIMENYYDEHQES